MIRTEHRNTPHPIFGRGKIISKIFSIAAISAFLASCTLVDSAKDFVEENEKEVVGDRQSLVDDKNSSFLLRKALLSEPAKFLNEWTRAGSNNQNNPGHLTFGIFSGKREWQANKRDGTPILVAAEPVVANGMIFLLDREGTVYALKLSDASLLWEKSLRPFGETSTARGAGMAVEGNNLFVASGYSEVYRIVIDSGLVVWNAALDSTALGAPVIFGDSLFITTVSSGAYVVSTIDGELKYRVRLNTSGTPGTLRGKGAAISNDGEILIAPPETGLVLATKTADGKRIWSQPLGTGAFVFTRRASSSISERPVIKDDRVYVVGADGNLAALRLDNGRVIKQWKIVVADVPVATKDVVFVTSVEHALMAIETETSEIIWRTSLSNPNEKITWYGPLYASGKLWMGSSSGEIVTVDATNGDITRSISIGDGIAGHFLMAEGKLITIEEKGIVRAYR